MHLSSILLVLCVCVLTVKGEEQRLPFSWHSVSAPVAAKRALGGEVDMPGLAKLALTGMRVPRPSPSQQERSASPSTTTTTTTTNMQGCVMEVSELSHDEQHVPSESVRYFSKKVAGPEWISRTEEVKRTLSLMTGTYVCRYESGSNHESGQVRVVMNLDSSSGKPEVFGFFSTDALPLAIVVEPSFHTVGKISNVNTRDAAKSLGDHIVYRHSSAGDLDTWLTAQNEGITFAEAAARPKAHSCGNDESHNHHVQTSPAPASVSSRSLERRAVDSCDIPLVGDSAFFASMGNSFGTAAAYVHALMTASNSIYRTQTSNGFSVTNIYMFEAAGADPYITAAGTSNGFLDAVTADISDYGAPNKCLVHGFTASNWGGVAGVAWVGTVCSTTYGAGVTTVGSGATPASISSRIIVVAHEIGHNWGSQHDASGTQIMAPSSGGNSIATFSAASLGYFSSTSRTCLKDIGPDTSIAFCANGVLEVNNQEQCDCGEKCASDPTCTSGCLLEGAAQCSPGNGACCSSTGQLLPAGTVCGTHAAEGYAFLQRYCTGTSAVCPTSYPSGGLSPCRKYSNTCPCDRRVAAANPCAAGCYIDTQTPYCDTQGTAQCDAPNPADGESVLPDGTQCSITSNFGRCLSGVCCDQGLPTCPAGAQCGTVTNACGVTVQCGPQCGPTRFCVNNQCSGTPPPAPPPPPPIIVPAPAGGAAEDETSSAGGSDGGMIAGIIIGVLIFIVILAVVGFLVYKKRHDSGSGFAASPVYGSAPAYDPAPAAYTPAPAASTPAPAAYTPAYVAAPAPVPAPARPTPPVPTRATPPVPTRAAPPPVPGRAPPPIPTRRGPAPKPW